MTNRYPDTDDEELPSNRKPTWWVYVLVAFIILIILQKVGCGPMRTENKMEWIDR